MSRKIQSLWDNLLRVLGFRAASPPSASSSVFDSTASPVEHAPDVAVLRSRRFKATQEHHRVIYVNDYARNRPFRYADNRIRTYKYTVLSFLPVNLFEQFQRVANFYFLFFVILVLIPFFSPIMPEIFIFPLVFVLAVTAVKDAFDDIQRHRNDGTVNNRISYVYQQGLLVQRKWKDVAVGDIIRLESDHFVAADVLLLSTSEPNGLCYIETCELDGETNLKVRQCLPATSLMSERFERTLNARIVCEAPNEVLNRFRGTLEIDENALEQLPTTSNDRTQPGPPTLRPSPSKPSMRKYALSSEQMLLRGCIMRNTQWCYAVVVYCGRDTKLMQNSGKDKHKTTSLDRKLNKVILGLILFLIFLCFWCSIGYSIFERSTGYGFQTFMPWPTNVVGNSSSATDQNVYGFDDQMSDISILSVLMFFSFSILLNGIVPISLYVSVEFLRALQSLFIDRDSSMVDRNGVYARARSTTLNEELGQIEYIFSDKTGTLTENVMTFRYCSIAGRCFGMIEEADGGLRAPNSNADERVDFSKLNSMCDEKFEFFDHRLAAEAKNENNANVDLFLRLLAICHTVMSEEAEEPEQNEQQTSLKAQKKQIIYQAQSPDEGALVSAARNFGFMFVDRTPTTITINVRGVQQTYDVLAIFDFNNVRKRMSVLVRESSLPNGNMLLLMKGADNVVMERLDASMPSNNEVRQATESDLDKFAVDGLRTLVLAYRQIEPSEFQPWLVEYEQAQQSIEDRDERLDAVYEKLEKNMILIGCTAIEDKLQEGVPDTIAQLLDAGIRIWVITGDKMETAVNIGYSCKLLHDALDRVFIIDGQTEETVAKQLVEARNFIEQSSGATVQQPVVAGHGAEAMQQSSLSCVGNMKSSVRETSTAASATSSLMRASRASYTLPVRNKGTKPITALSMPRTFALVMLGSSFACVLNTSAHHQHPLEDLLLRVGTACSTVLCCRATPLQKALIVRMVRKRRRAVTLAVGDGANDVSMIKEAHVGIGISGQEGMQAVMASDYSIGQFRFLSRLLLVHGRWSYYRMSKFYNYFFYKNFAFSMSHFFYAMICGYTAESVYDPWMITLYNVVYTSLPVMAMGCLDQDVNDTISLQQPALYLVNLRGKLFNWRTITMAAFGGLVTALIIVFGNLLLWQHDSDIGSKQAFSDATQTHLFLAVTLEICWMTKYWTWLNVVTVIFSFFTFLGFGALQYCNVLATSYTLVPFASYRGVHHAVYARGDYWLATVLMLCILVTPAVAYRWLRKTMAPSIQEQIRRHPHLTWSMASAYTTAAQQRPVTDGSAQRLPNIQPLQPSKVRTAAFDERYTSERGGLPAVPNINFRVSHDSMRKSTLSGQHTLRGVSQQGSPSTRQFQPQPVRSSYAFSQESGWAKIIQQGLNMRVAVGPAADNLKKFFTNASPARIVEKLQVNMRPLTARLALNGTASPVENSSSKVRLPTPPAAVPAVSSTMSPVQISLDAKQTGAVDPQQKISRDERISVPLDLHHTVSRIDEANDETASNNA